MIVGEAAHGCCPLEHYGSLPPTMPDNFFEEQMERIVRAFVLGWTYSFLMTFMAQWFVGVDTLDSPWVYLVYGVPAGYGLVYLFTDLHSNRFRLHYLDVVIGLPVVGIASFIGLIDLAKSLGTAFFIMSSIVCSKFAVDFALALKQRIEPSPKP